MRRTTASAPRLSLYLLVFAACADNDKEFGFSATQGAVVTSISSATADLDDSSTGAASTDGTMGSVAPTTGLPGTSTGPGDGSNSGAMDTGEAGDSSSTSGTSGTSGTSETSGTSGEDTTGAPSFAVDIWPIFAERCSCHQDANGAGKVRLAMEDAYMNLIDQPAYQLPEMMRVAPGSAEDSYLWHKLNDTQEAVGGKGKRMPPGGLLKMVEREKIQQWIDGGADP